MKNKSVVLSGEGVKTLVRPCLTEHFFLCLEANMSDEVAMTRRIQPFIPVDHDVLKECRKRGEATPEMLLTYFVLQEMGSNGEWSDEDPLTVKRLSKLTGLDHPIIIKTLNEFDTMGVFNEEER